MHRWCLLLLVGGCGRFQFDARSSDASSDTTTVDAVPTGPFGAPERLDTLSTAFEEDDITLSGDELEIYFQSDRSGPDSYHLYRSVRTSRSEPWPEPELVAELASPSADELSPELSRDGLTLYYSSEPPGNGDLLVTTRASRTEPWPPGQLVTPVNSADEDIGPTITSTNLELVFHSSRPGRGLRDLYRSTRATTADPWGSPTLISELSTADYDESAFFIDDLRLVFGARRAGGRGGLDLYIATRPAIGAPFGEPVPIDEINTDADETDPWVSPDGAVLYFMSDRDGTPDLYRAVRQ